ncbi:putative protease [Bacillus sp. TS-2]|nr:putative protease [Bacillus sp. TS-2]
MINTPLEINLTIFLDLITIMVLIITKITQKMNPDNAKRFTPSPLHGKFYYNITLLKIVI